MNLPEQLTVDITQNDIDIGIRQNCRECPLAIATTRTVRALNVNLGEAIHAEVGSWMVTVYLDGMGVDTYEHNGMRFIRDFDMAEAWEKPPPRTVKMKQISTRKSHTEEED